MDLVYRFEKNCSSLRHSRVLKSMAPLWDVLRPVYNRLIKLLGSSGLVRRINGTDTLRLAPECRDIGEIYEPEVWATVMQHVKAGSRVIDVGAHFGLYAMAFGLRVGKGGQVLAAEPDPENLAILRKHIQLNGLEEIISVVPVAISDHSGTATLSTGSLQSHVSECGSVNITLQTLDETVGTDKWDLMLIDVEGHEEKVLRGGRAFLSDPARRPSMILIEVHPYAWENLGTTSASLLHEMKGKGYTVSRLDGSMVMEIKEYGHIMATII